MTPAHWSGLLSTAEAARFAGVKPATIRRWRWLGYLELIPGRDGLDERGYPLHSVEAVREAERLARESGLNSATGADPRRLRGRTRPRRQTEDDLERGQACPPSGSPLATLPSPS